MAAARCGDFLFGDRVKTKTTALLIFGAAEIVVFCTIFGSVAESPIAAWICFASFFLWLPWGMFDLYERNKGRRDDVPRKLWAIFAATFVFAFNGLFFAVFNGVASESSPTWKMSWRSSPCGRSSCSSSETQTSVPYNPTGWFKETTNVDSRQTYCHYVECRWGDRTGVLPNGYPAVTGSPTTPDVSSEPCAAGNLSCAFLATKNGDDYPDPGTGLADGWKVGEVSTNLDFCAGVDNVWNGAAFGKGRTVCATCTAYQTSRGWITDAVHLAEAERCEAPPHGYDFFCFACETASRNDPRQREIVAATTFAHWAFYFSTIPLILYDPSPSPDHKKYDPPLSASR